jgi:predicted dehydrogenase
VKPLRTAVIGVGHLGRIHTRLISGLDSFLLAGVVDPVEQNRLAVAAEYHTTAHASHDELVGQIDAAVIATPTRFHHHVALDLLRRGIHVLVEKPLAASLAEAEELVQAARQHGALLQVGHVERFNPAWSLALPHLREPKYIEAVRRGGFSFRSTDIGVVLDLMIHDLDLVLSLVRSEVRQVEALGVSIFGRHEDAANARLTFENGCVAALSVSRASPNASRVMQVWSRRGFASIDFSTRSATFIRPGESLLRREFDVDRLSPEEKQQFKDTQCAALLPMETLQAEPQDAITAELMDFADSIRQGRSPRVPGEHGRDALAVAEQILRKIETHAWDGVADGPVGPLAIPRTQIIPGPHWSRKPLPAEHREAG